jgi:hypothetical protein
MNEDFLTGFINGVLSVNYYDLNLSFEVIGNKEDWKVLFEYQTDEFEIVELLQDENGNRMTEQEPIVRKTDFIIGQDWQTKEVEREITYHLDLLIS